MHFHFLRQQPVFVHSESLSGKQIRWLTRSFYHINCNCYLEWWMYIHIACIYIEYIYMTCVCVWVTEAIVVRFANSSYTLSWQKEKKCYIFIVLIFFFIVTVLFYRYRISLFSQWKQRGMYAACMWIVQLLLVVSKVDSVFLYIPEFYLETLVHRSSLFRVQLEYSNSVLDSFIPPANCMSSYSLFLEPNTQLSLLLLNFLEKSFLVVCRGT